MQQVLKWGVIGIVSIGFATALFMPGRQTIGGINAVTNGTAHIMHTAETGQA